MAFLGVLALPGTAAAANAYATADVNMRAGPSTAYPVITTIYGGAPVTVHGCLSDYSWCDVSWRGDRGWVSDNYLTIVYAERRVPVPSYAVAVGIPTVSFGFGYWDDHYRSRPWYRDRDRWWGDDRDWDRGRDRDRDWDRGERRAERREFRRERERFDRQRDRIQARIEEAQEDGNRDRVQRLRDRLQDRREAFQRERCEFDRDRC